MKKQSQIPGKLIVLGMFLWLIAMTLIGFSFVLKIQNSSLIDIGAHSLSAIGGGLLIIGIILRILDPNKESAYTEPKQ